MKRPLHPLPGFDAFTITSIGGVAAKIITEVRVSAPFDPASPPTPLPPLYHTNALWDTGASNSVITQSTAKALGLIPHSMARLAHAGGVDDVNVYLVNLILPNRLMVHTVGVTEIKDSNDFGVLIGMDIITLGDFAITNRNGATTVSFRIPSIATIDYVDESRRINKEAPIGRNDPCPCGSGKKHKNCHGR